MLFVINGFLDGDNTVLPDSAPASLSNNRLQSTATSSPPPSPPPENPAGTPLMESARVTAGFVSGCRTPLFTPPVSEQV